MQAGQSSLSPPVWDMIERPSASRCELCRTGNYLGPQGEGHKGDMPVITVEERQMSERFELLDIARDISGKLSLIYGSGPADPAPFVLTLTPQYVREHWGRRRRSRSMKQRNTPMITPVI